MENIHEKVKLHQCEKCPYQSYNESNVKQHTQSSWVEHTSVNFKKRVLSAPAQQRLVSAIPRNFRNLSRSDASFQFHHLSLLSFWPSEPPPNFRTATLNNEAHMWMAALISLFARPCSCSSDLWVEISVSLTSTSLIRWGSVKHWLRTARCFMLKFESLHEWFWFTSAQKCCQSSC